MLNFNKTKFPIELFNGDNTKWTDELNEAFFKPIGYNCVYEPLLVLFIWFVIFTQLILT